MNQLLFRSLAPSTTRSYNAAFQKYLHFCQTHDLKALPIYETNMMLFITCIEKTSISNIKTHISAVKHFAAIFSGNKNLSSHHYMLVRSIKRKAKQSIKRIPATLTHLKLIHAFLWASPWPLSDKIVIWAANTTAFFGFLRSSEYVSPNTEI